nr:hypothetical protein Iba_scaffold5942CG0240 [Ipomoea batatas]
MAFPATALHLATSCACSWAKGELCGVVNGTEQLLVQIRKQPIAKEQRVSAIFKLSIVPNPIPITARRWGAVSSLLASTRTLPIALVCMDGKLSGRVGTSTFPKGAPTGLVASRAEIVVMVFRAWDLNTWEIKP